MTPSRQDDPCMEDEDMRQDDPCMEDEDRRQDDPGTKDEDLRESHPWMEAEQMRRSLLAFIDRVALEDEQERYTTYCHGPLRWYPDGRFGPAQNSPTQVVQSTAWEGTPGDLAARQAKLRTDLWIDMVGAIFLCIELWIHDHAGEMVLCRESLETQVLALVSPLIPEEAMFALKGMNPFGGDEEALVRAYPVFQWVTAKQMKEVIEKLPLKPLDEKLPEQIRQDLYSLHIVHTMADRAASDGTSRA